MPETKHFDVVIIGGAFSGAALALRVLRRRPGTSVLVVERSAKFDRKVGESTSDIAGCFLTRQLGLTSYLAREHLVKHGLRLWFNRDRSQPLEGCTEIGPRTQGPLPTYQLDREKLDTHLLNLAASEGAEVWRPAVVKSLGLASPAPATAREVPQNGATAARGGPGEPGRQRLEVEFGGELCQVEARWVADASGKAAFLPRQLGFHRRLDAHPVNSVWSRFRGVRDFDDLRLRGRCKGFDRGVLAPRGTATNHLVGDGWWCWLIALHDGDLSAGVVYDPRRFTLERRGNLTETLLAHLRSHPVGRELFGEAEPVPGDTRSYSHLPYFSEHVAGDGWVVVGDAAGFIDPLYSQGLDFCSHTVSAAEKIVCAALDGDDVAAATADYDRAYPESYHRWFNALYLDKYEYIGDAELMWAAFQLDISLYILAPTWFVYNDPETEFGRLPYNGKIAGCVARFMALYNRRLVRLGRRRREAGVFGTRNDGHRFLLKTPFAPGARVLRVFGGGLWLWLRCEVRGLFLRPARRQPVAQAQPGTARGSATAGRGAQPTGSS